MIKDPVRQEAIKLLKECSDILDIRGNTYGNILPNLTMQSKLWSAYFGIDITEEDVCIAYALTKIARDKQGNKYHKDNAVDIANYSVMSSAIKKTKQERK